MQWSGTSHQPPPLGSGQCPVQSSLHSAVPSTRALGRGSGTWNPAASTLHIFRPTQDTPLPLHPLGDLWPPVQGPLSPPGHWAAPRGHSQLWGRLRAGIAPLAMGRRTKASFPALQLERSSSMAVAGDGMVKDGLGFQMGPGGLGMSVCVMCHPKPLSELHPGLE